MKAAIVSLVLLLTASLAYAGPVNYELRRFPKIPVHVVTVDLSSPLVSVQAQMAVNGLGTSESFRSMLRRTRPVAAITGAFFDVRSKHPVGDIAIKGQFVCRGLVGSGVCVTKEGDVQIVPRYKGTSTDWRGYDTVICGGPTLLRGGHIALRPRKEGFHDPGLFRMRRRTAAGLTFNNKLLLVSINKPVSLRRLALVMKALKCKDAITLDGGSSAGLWFNGRILSQPTRKLTNLLAVYLLLGRRDLMATVSTEPIDKP